jgi:hypothetical protein
VILPIAEVGNEILANLASRVLSGVGIETLPVAQDLEGHEPDWEQYTPTFPRFSFSSFSYFGLNPLAAHAKGGQNEKKFVMEPNGFVDLVVKLLAPGYRAERTSNAPLGSAGPCGGDQRSLDLSKSS